MKHASQLASTSATVHINGKHYQNIMIILHPMLRLNLNFSTPSEVK